MIKEKYSKSSKKELNLFVFKSLFKINNKSNSSMTQVTYPMILILTLDKKLLFIQSLYYNFYKKICLKDYWQKHKQEVMPCPTNTMKLTAFEEKYSDVVPVIIGFQLKHSLRILTGKKHPKLRLNRSRKRWIWIFD